MRKLHGFFTMAVIVLLTGCGSTQGGTGASSILGTWEGRVVTEAINVTLELQITSPGSGDAGNWKFVGANGQILNQGDLQAWVSGSDVVVILLQEGAIPAEQGSATLYGDLSANGQQIEGQYAPFGPGGHGGFEVTKQ